jgi:hypothetical protein
MYFASFGAENNPLDRAFGKLEGIGGGGEGGGGAPIPITLPRVLRFELFLIGIFVLQKCSVKGRFEALAGARL